MRLPTIGYVVSGAWSAARRFPIVLVAGVVAAGAGIALVDEAGDTSDWTRLLLSATLGFPLCFAVAVLGERRARTSLGRWSVVAAGVLVLAGFWAAWPHWSMPVQALRYAQLSVAFHLMVAFLPYTGYAEPNGFWQYNKALFLRFLAAALYSAVLYAGLATALLALDKLLGVDVAPEGYARLWMVMAFVFNTWFFVAGAPADLASLELRSDYPPGLKIFTQNVLVPIVAIYLLILTAYLAKVLITRQWPNGWIGYLVSGIAAVGILSWLLVRPLEERPEQQWVRTFTRGFYIALMPAIVMLWLAIWKRVEQYGITERRYFLIVLSVWLAGIAVYYTVGRSRSIKVIPASLCAIALITFAGPWGAYAVSRTSQVRRLQAVLARNDLLANGVLHRTTREVPPDDRREISGGLRYLLGTHGEGAIARWLGDSLRHALAVSRGSARLRGSGEAGARVVMAALNLDYLAEGEAAATQYFSYEASPAPQAFDIAGYGYALPLSIGNARDSLRVTGTTFVRLGSDSMSLRVTRSGAVLLELPLQRLVDGAAPYRRLNPNRPVPAAELCVRGRRDTGAALVCLRRLSGMRRQGATRVTSLDGALFLRLP